MSDRQARTAGLRTRPTVLGVLLVITALTGVVGCGSLAGSAVGASPRAVGPTAHPPLERLQGAHQHGLGVADGEVPDGVMVFDDTYPAVANLDGALLAALRTAARAAGGDGIEFYVNSGWRSPAYQEQLLDQAVSTYGSRAAAARWVATPTTSPHVSGDAVDIGGSHAADWLSEHGAAYGLCQIYRNEPWHYELRPDAVDHSCPRAYADPTHDPRMR